MNYYTMPIDTKVDFFALVIMLCCCFSVCKNTQLDTDEYPRPLAGAIFPPDKYDSLVTSAEQAAADQAYLSGIVSEIISNIRRKAEHRATVVMPYPVEIDTFHK